MSTPALFEEASIAARSPEESKRKAAEQWLMQFRFDPNCIPISQSILVSTTNHMCMYEAFNTLTLTVVRVWGEMDIATRGGLRDGLLDFLISRLETGMIPRYVTNKALQCISSLWKRTWLDLSDDDDAEHEALCQLLFIKLNVLLSRGIEYKTLAVQLLVSLVLEFSDTKASSIGQ
jgi:hypothetical protein